MLTYISSLQSTVRNPLPMHPGRATRWWVGVLLACVAVCMTTNYRMVLRERFDLTRVLVRRFTTPWTHTKA